MKLTSAVDEITIFTSRLLIGACGMEKEAWISNENEAFADERVNAKTIIVDRLKVECALLSVLTGIQKLIL